MDMFLPTNRTGCRVIEATPFARTPAAKAGVLLSFDTRDKFVEVRTLPVGSFFGTSSIVDIRFQKSALNSSACEDAESNWFADTVDTAANILGATMVNLKLSREFQNTTESYLFFVKQPQAGTRQELEWHYCRIPHAAIDFVGWSHYAAPQMWQLEHQGIDRRKYGQKALVEPEFADALNFSVAGKVTVAVAARTSKTPSEEHM
ncbi:hypothetical protein CCHR01_16883 [Colletotrichum chrysophilum]|uniref:Uncharacterized protein n=1 Tax=Colletotrichum chrysophilum TaxID=1836956 RepID=A0AAD9ED18_9PEZI|nr:hypothetical protein CCHR01_16883 [Colletotrichum chrysophilum]